MSSPPDPLSLRERGDEKRGAVAWLAAAPRCTYQKQIPRSARFAPQKQVPRACGARDDRLPRFFEMKK